MVFGSILYFFLGLILAAPYAWLSGGDVLDFVTAACFAPFVALGLFTIYNIPPIRIVGGEVVRGKRNYLFWTVLAYVCLPVVFNGAAHACRWMGYEQAAGLLFNARYLALLMFPFMVMALVLAGVLIGWVASLFKKSSPPSDGVPPPNNGTGKTASALLRKKGADDRPFQLCST